MLAPALMLAPTLSSAVAPESRRGRAVQALAAREHAGSFVFPAASSVPLPPSSPQGLGNSYYGGEREAFNEPAWDVARAELAALRAHLRQHTLLAHAGTAGALQGPLDSAASLDKEQPSVPGAGPMGLINCHRSLEQDRWQASAIGEAAAPRAALLMPPSAPMPAPEGAEKGSLEALSECAAEEEEERAATAAAAGDAVGGGGGGGDGLGRRGAGADIAAFRRRALPAAPGGGSSLEPFPPLIPPSRLSDCMCRTRSGHCRARGVDGRHLRGNHWLRAGASRSANSWRGEPPVQSTRLPQAGRGGKRRLGYVVRLQRKRRHPLAEQRGRTREIAPGPRTTPGAGARAAAPQATARFPREALLTRSPALACSRGTRRRLRLQSGTAAAAIGRSGARWRRGVDTSGQQHLRRSWWRKARRGRANRCRLWGKR